MWTQDDEEKLALIKAHTLNNLKHIPKSVDLNDKLWLIQKIEEQTARYGHTLTSARPMRIRD
jgi:hypothetical protein